MFAKSINIITKGQIQSRTHKHFVHGELKPENIIFISSESALTSPEPDTLMTVCIRRSRQFYMLLSEFHVNWIIITFYSISFFVPILGIQFSKNATKTGYLLDHSP